MNTGELVVEGLVDGSDFGADPGTIVALAGPPGTATSVLLATIAGIEFRRSGTVLLAGQRPTPRDVGFMGRPARLFQELTAAENVSVPLLARGREADRAVVEATLASLLLGPATWHNLVEQLSGGQQQRVAVARALVTGAPLICLDEPVTELDERSVEAVVAAVRAAADRGAIVVVATADPDLHAQCDLVVRVAG